MGPAVAVSPIRRYEPVQGIQWSAGCNADVSIGLDPTNAARNLHEKFAWYHWRWGPCRHAVSENRQYQSDKYHYDKPVSSSVYEGGSPSTFQVRVGASGQVEYVADGVLRYTSAQQPWATGDTLYVSASWQFTHKPFNFQWVAANGDTIGPVWT